MKSTGVLGSEVRDEALCKLNLHGTQKHNRAAGRER